MKIKSALKKLEKAGFQMVKGAHSFYFEGERNTISFCWNGKLDLEDDAMLFHIRRNTDKHDYMTDYHAGYFVDNCKKLIESMNAA